MGRVLASALGVWLFGNKDCPFNNARGHEWKGYLWVRIGT